MTPVPNMLDMFHGDNREHIPDFAALKAQGIKAVFLKASEGDHYTDPRYAERRVAAFKADMPCGAYHFGNSAP